MIKQGHCKIERSDWIVWMSHILVDIRICVCWTVRSKNTLKQGKLWQFLKGTAKPKVKEKVIDFEELKGIRTLPRSIPTSPHPWPSSNISAVLSSLKKLKYSIKLLNSIWPFFFLTWPPSSKFSTTFLHDTNSSKPEISVDFTSRTKLVQSSRRTLAAFSLKLAWQSAQSLTNNRAPFESAFSSMSSSFLLLIVWTGLWANLNTPSRFEKAMISEVERAPVCSLASLTRNFADDPSCSWQITSLSFEKQKYTAVRAHKSPEVAELFL